MQTTGASLVAVNWPSPAHVRTLAQDSRGAHGLLYLAAVLADWREQEHRQETVDTDPPFISYRDPATYLMLFHRRCKFLPHV